MIQLQLAASDSGTVPQSLPNDTISERQHELKIAQQLHGYYNINIQVTTSQEMYDISKTVTSSQDMQQHNKTSNGITIHTTTSREMKQHYKICNNITRYVTTSRDM